MKGRGGLALQGALAATLAAAAVVLGAWVASAAPLASCSRTTLRPGQSITVAGTGATPGDTALLQFDGSVIGASTVDGFGNFSVSGTIPSSALPGIYQVTVTLSTPPSTLTPCFVTIEAAATPTPSPTETPVPSSPPPPPSPPSLPVGVPQQQQQQQQIFVPVSLPAPPSHAVSVPSGSLPTTGFEATDFAEGGTGTLMIGLSLMEFARRRKRRLAALRARGNGAERVPASLSGACPVCGRVSSLGAAYCDWCGRALVAPAPSTEVETKAAPPAAPGPRRAVLLPFPEAPARGSVSTEPLLEPEPPCSLCGFPNPPTSRFCGGCGTGLLARRCSACGAVHPPVLRFCRDCGTPLGDVPVGAAQ